MMKCLYFLVIVNILLSYPRTSTCSNSCKETCILCQEEPCQCESYAREEGNQWDLKKLIIQIISNTCSSCGNFTCSKGKDRPREKQNVRDAMVEILRCCKNDNGASAKEAALRLLSKTCGQEPCVCGNPPCSKLLRKVLLNFLLKVYGLKKCECKEIQACTNDSARYWFHPSKEDLRKETPPKHCQVRERHPDPCIETPNVKTKREVVCHDLEVCRTLRCPRYKPGEPALGHFDPFSVCADCDNCRIFPASDGEDVILFCERCQNVKSPFKMYTPNGYETKIIDRRDKTLYVQSKYLQLNDFRFLEPPKATDIKRRSRCSA